MIGYLRVILILVIGREDGVEIRVCSVLRAIEIVLFPALKMRNFYSFPILPFFIPTTANLGDKSMRPLERLLEPILIQLILSMLRM